MDFELDWNLFDARNVTSEAHKAYDQDPENKEKRRILTEEGLMYSRSLEVLNEECMDLMAEYRRRLKWYVSKSKREKKLDELYEDYCNKMDKKNVADKMLSISGFIKSVLF